MSSASHRGGLESLVALVGDLEPGTVSLVGAGPGDSALISVRGAVRLTQADVVLHDQLIGPELLDLIRPDAERIFVGKRQGRHAWRQDAINRALVEHARAGRRVVRLKGGDPFVFGRGGEECLHLASARVRFEVVPGITATFGAPATAGIPLTHRGLSRSFALVTGHVGTEAASGEKGSAEKGTVPISQTDAKWGQSPDAKWGQSPLDFAALARMETLAIYMGVTNLAQNCQGLLQAGLNPRTPVAVIEWGTCPQQRTIIGSLTDIAERAAAAGLAPPALVLIGAVVRLRESLEWFERRPLHGQRIVVTRMRDQAATLSAPLRAAGAEVIEAPTIELAPVDDYTLVDAALRDIQQYSWLVLTSANGVDALFARLQTIGRDARGLAGVRIAAVGPATAARLAAAGIRADLVPDEAVGEALAQALIGQGVAGRALLLRGDLARKDLVSALETAGVACDDLPGYRTVCPASLPERFLARIDERTIDWVTLTSPSSFVNLLSLLGPQRAAALRQVKLASIGPVTTRAIRDAGFEVAVEAVPHDIPGLVSAIRKALGK